MKRSLIVLTSILAVVVIAAPDTALADPPPWTFVEAGYANLDLDDQSDDGDGVFVGGSFGLENWHFFGRYQDASTDDLDIDVERLVLGAGWHGGLLTEKADLFAEVAYVDAEIEPIDDEGYFVRGGVRFRPINMFEVRAAGRWEDVDELDDDFVVELTGVFYFWRLGAGLTYEAADDIDTYTAFIRFDFTAN